MTFLRPFFVFRYAISTGPGSELFGIDSGTGLISTTAAARFDRETTAEYILVVTATDTAEDGQQPRLGAAIVNIVIADVNDNTPAFVDAAYAGTVDENAAGVEVAVVDVRHFLAQFPPF